MCARYLQIFQWVFDHHLNLFKLYHSFITYKTPKEAEDGIGRYHGFMLGDSMLRVKLSTKNNQSVIETLEQPHFNGAVPEEKASFSK